MLIYITVGGVADSGNAFNLSTGAGIDTVVIASGAGAVKVDYNGGAGVDVLQLADGANISTATINLTSVEEISLVGGGTTTMAASFISGKTFIVSENGTGAADLVISMDQTTLDLSNLALRTSFASGTDEVIADGSAVGLPQTFTGSAGDDVYTGGAGIDTITGGDGADTINGGSGVDTITLTETTAAIDTVKMFNTGGGSDDIVGFTAGAGGDKISIDVDDATTGTAISALKDGAGNAAVSAGETVGLAVITAATTLVAQNIIIIDTPTAGITAAEMEVLLEDSGGREITLANAPTANDDLVIVYDDGTDTHVGIFNLATTAVKPTAAGVFTEICTIKGLADATTLHAENFVFG